MGNSQRHFLWKKQKKRKNKNKILSEEKFTFNTRSLFPWEYTPASSSKNLLLLKLLKYIKKIRWWCNELSTRVLWNKFPLIYKKSISFPKTCWKMKDMGETFWLILQEYPVCYIMRSNLKNDNMGNFYVKKRQLIYFMSLKTYEHTVNSSI